MKRFALVLAILCLLAGVVLADEPADMPAAVLCLPDFTGTGSAWEVLAVSSEGAVNATVTPVYLTRSEDPNAVMTYEVRLEGSRAGDAYVHLELCRDGVPSWRYNLYVTVDAALNVRIETAELMLAYGDVSHAVIEYGESERFSEAERMAAISVVLDDFSAPHGKDQEHCLSGWAGFVLQTVSYASDEASRAAFETYAQRYGYLDSQGRAYVDGIVFYTTFRTPMTDDGWTSFAADSVYSDYRWTLLKTEDGAWEIVTTGY